MAMAKYAAQLLEHVGAPGLVAVDDGLGVAVRDEGVAQRLELGAELLEVVDLAVERDGHGAVGVLHGLAGAFEVDDGQAAKSHRDVVVHEEALVIGPAVGDAIGHILDDRLVRFPVEIDRSESHESAHVAGSPPERVPARSRGTNTFTSSGMIRHAPSNPKIHKGKPQTDSAELHNQTRRRQRNSRILTSSFVLRAISPPERAPSPRRTMQEQHRTRSAIPDSAIDARDALEKHAKRKNWLLRADSRAQGLAKRRKRICGLFS